MKNKKQKNSLNNYAKYSGIAFQMLTIILIGVFGGIKLDEFLSFEFPLFTLIFTILAVALSIYYTIKDLLK
ncbi:MAG: AtpZ/AtpI family protein [Bacteroidetes bacterium]|jgi:F0F1-type ATP synthase assembly protein I|nr:AtpZ/AtpI family protein [Bacteroidota bacterium]MBT6687419.1 AtpZ/AtpI family protein [Bacteroidota bacterium]MBT7144897.1 AtpZ/AtpI family protein [Bacteroidota bacterium]MBT7493329.1 AtpZ/AtpI family protein [Bacteroidota bacterium]